MLPLLHDLCRVHFAITPKSIYFRIAAKTSRRIAVCHLIFAVMLTHSYHRSWTVERIWRETFSNLSFIKLPPFFDSVMCELECTSTISLIWPESLSFHRIAFAFNRNLPQFKRHTNNLNIPNSMRTRLLEQDKWFGLLKRRALRVRPPVDYVLWRYLDWMLTMHIIYMAKTRSSLAMILLLNNC